LVVCSEGEVDQTSKRYHIRRRREAPLRGPVRRKQMAKKFFQAVRLRQFQADAALQYVTAV
jgi:hypothetical protein